MTAAETTSESWTYFCKNCGQAIVHGYNCPLEGQPVTFPVEWNEWNRAYKTWRASTKLIVPTNLRIPGRNLMADEVLGTWRLRDGVHVVELSEVTFPDLGTGHGTRRYVGITWRGDNGLSSINGGLVDNFDALDAAIAAGPPVE